jgi:hypothetical protein
MKDILEIQLVSEHDTILWKLESRGKFSVKSTYNALTSSEGGVQLLETFGKGRSLQKLSFFSS